MPPPQLGPGQRLVSILDGHGAGPRPRLLREDAVDGLLRREGDLGVAPLPQELVPLRRVVNGSTTVAEAIKSEPAIAAVTVVMLTGGVDLFPPGAAIPASRLARCRSRRGAASPSTRARSDIRSRDNPSAAVRVRVRG